MEIKINLSGDLPQPYPYNRHQYRRAKVVNRQRGARKNHTALKLAQARKRKARAKRHGRKAQQAKQRRWK